MARKKDRWLMPTNTDNLRMIIAQGLISSQKGFKKYYSDVLELFPGYVPLFRNRIQPDILNSVVSETEGLTPCILEFDLNAIEGLVKTINGNELVDVELGDIEKESIGLLLILAPVPISCISKVIFKTSNDKKSFEEDANLYSNVPLHNIKLHYTKVDQKLFEANAEITDYPIDKLKSIELGSVNEPDYNKTYAFGGLLANLFYFAKNGQMSHNAFISCCDGEYLDSKEDFSLILNYFNNIKSSISEEDPNKNTYIYEGVIDTAINSKDFKEGIIDFLESDTRTVKIASKLKTFETVSDKPISEEFREATTVFGKTLLMLFLREDSESLIDYNLDIFTEEDYLTFAMIFGIRDKFIKIPKFLREFEELQSFISTKMANYVHETLNNQIKFKEPKQPLTIIDMLKKDRFKEYIAKELKIENCFQTIIPKSDYIVVKGKPVFTGIVMPKFELLEEKYFEFISKYKLIEYNKFLQKYEKVK